MLETLFNWLPMFVLIGVWIYFIRQMQGDKSARSFQQSMEDLVVEQRRGNERLEQILAAMDKRISTLEEPSTR